MPGASLLIIDDEPAIGALVRRIGESCGYRVTDVADFASFRASFTADPPSVIALDLSMPGTDGVELLGYLASEKCTSPLLIVSGYTTSMIGTAVRFGEALGLNIAGVLGKPLHVVELRDLLQQLDQANRPEAA